MELMLFAKSISWIDDCRIPFVDETLNGGGYGGKNMGTAVYALSDGRKTLPTNKLKKEDFVEPSGRFPANILVSDDMLNDGIDRKGFSGGGGPTRFANATGGKKLDDYNYYGDKGSSSRYYDIDKWFEKLLESCE